MERNVEKNPRYTKLHLNPTYKQTKTHNFRCNFFLVILIFGYFCSFVPVFCAISCWCAVDINNKKPDQHKRISNKKALIVRCVYFFQVPKLVSLAFVCPSRYVSFHLTNYMWYIINRIMSYKIHSSILWLHILNLTGDMLTISSNLLFLYGYLTIQCSFVVYSKYIQGLFCACFPFSCAFGEIRPENVWLRQERTIKQNLVWQCQESFFKTRNNP